MTLIHFILDTQFFKLSYSIVNNFNFWKKNKLILEPHIIVNLDTFLKASSPKETSCLRLLNPPTIDGCGEGAWWSRRGLQAILEGNHDNPESSTHQAPSAKQHPERREDWGQKNNYDHYTQKQYEQNDWLLRKRCKITKALLNPKTAPYPISGGDR